MRPGEREWRVRREDPAHPDVVALLEAHRAAIEATAPAESRHALEIDALRVPDVDFWTLRDDDGALVACGALLALDAEHAEIKSMRTTIARLRQGAGARMLAHLVDEARRRGFRRLSLETGSMAYFEPARRMYAAAGFRDCAAFADYRPDPNSVFMTRELAS